MPRNKYYDSFDYSSDESSVQDLIMPGEQILWSGKPKKNAFIINRSVVMMPFALVWFCFDGFFISTLISSGEIHKMLFFIVPFFAIHLMPVWIWLWNVLSANKKWKNTEYAVTDKRILIRGGVIGYNYQNIYYTDINSVDLHVGVIDRMLGVGDILISQNGMQSTSKGTLTPAILDIENPQQIFKQIQKTVIDIQTDIHYPNDLRPDSNHGYNSHYRP
jgi:uncharacterized membrane protein YdbT with pleckstrin-like domain